MSPQEICERALAEICSVLQHVLDQDGEVGSIKGTVTRVRWTQVESVPHVDLIAGGRVIRLTAQDTGPHTHTFQGDGHCADCQEYDEDHDES